MPSPSPVAAPMSEKGLQRPGGQGSHDRSRQGCRDARYIGSTNYADIAQVDLVIEAVFEDIEVKKAVFRELDRV